MLNKKFFISLLLIVNFLYAYSSDRGGDNQRQKRQPPAEAISACESKSEGASCSVTTRRGDTVEGTCKNTPDGKYFACKPNHRRGPRGR